MDQPTIETEQPATEQSALVVQVQQFGLAPETNKTILDHFEPLFNQAEVWKRKAEAIVVTSIDQKREMQESRIARLALKDIRVKADKERKMLKEDSTRYGKAVQGVFNIIDYLIAPIEEHLLAQENYAEIQENKRKDALKEERLFMLLPYPDANPEYIDLRNMTDAAFTDLITGIKFAHEQKIEMARKAEEARIERERVEAERLKAEDEERERMRIENERLKVEAEAREKKMEEERLKAEKERKAIEEKARKEKAAADAKAKKLKEEQDAELKRIQNEAVAKLKVERELHEAKLEEERKHAAEAAARLNKMQADADARKLAEEQRLEAEKKLKEAESLRPDKEKLLFLADQLVAYQMPDVTSEQAIAVIVDVEKLLAKIYKFILDKAAEL